MTAPEAPAPALEAPGFRVTLTNPVAEHWESFIFANSTKCTKVVRHNSHAGKDVVICGAGPSLRETAAHYIDIARGPVWGCNSALIWLGGQGLRCSHGFCIDQTPQTADEWAAAPDARYLLASSTHPLLVDLLRREQRDITFFHSFCGTANEWNLYKSYYPPTVMVGEGLNSVNRAIAVADFMGFRRITVLGADCALGVGHEMHANGDGPTAHGATPVLMCGEIDGREWWTKPDMLFSAVEMARMRHRMGSRLRIIGDTLPAALMHHDEAFLHRVARLEASPGLAENIPNARSRAAAKGKELRGDVFQPTVLHYEPRVVAGPGTAPEPDAAAA